jgi:hypothetical protein
VPQLWCVKLFEEGFDWSGVEGVTVKRQRTLLHADGEPSKSPSGVMIIQSDSSRASKVPISSPEFILQNFIVESELPLASTLPFGLKATELTKPECPFSVRNSYWGDVFKL